MKLYKDFKNEIYGYADDGSQDYLIPNDFVALTSEEIIEWEGTNEKEKNKQKAKTLLSQSDWAVLPDVGIKNVDEYIAYRKILRWFIIKPQINAVFPVEPNPIWI